MNKITAMPKSAESKGEHPSVMLDEDDISTPRDDATPTHMNEDTLVALTSSAHQQDSSSALGGHEESKALSQMNAEKTDCSTPPTPPLPEETRAVTKRVSSSMEHVDLEYSLGSLDEHSPFKRRCSSKVKRKLHESPVPPIKSAADALKSKFWRDAAAVSEYNIASSSFDVANEEGGTSPLSVEEDGQQSGKRTYKTAASDFNPIRRRSSGSQHSIHAAQEAMRAAALTSSKLSEGESTPATLPTSNDKESLKPTNGTDEFDKQVDMRDDSGDKDIDSNISSASSLMDTFVIEEQEESRPFPPAPPSTPAAQKDFYRPVHQAGETGGELGYSIEFRRAQAPLDDTASTPPQDYIATTSTPLPPYLDPEAPTPLPDRKPPPKSSHNDAATPDLPDDGMARKRAAASTPAARKRPPALNKKIDFDKWDVGDRYELKRILGRGSYGEVAQAVDLRAVALQKKNQEMMQYQNVIPHRNSTYVAVKKISKAFDQEVDAIRLFREMHILRRLRGHECVIQLIDVVQPRSSDLKHFNDLYLVFEYVDTDLYKLIMSPQYLTTEHIQTFLYQMLVGLKYIHSSSVIHRDLKPA